MMKNRLKYILTFCGILLLLGSCDLDVRPTTAYDAESVYQDTKGAESVLEGAWNMMFESYSNMYTMGYAAYGCICDALGSDIVVNQTRTGYKSYHSFNVMHLSSESTVKYYWALFYEFINNCNDVIANVENARGSEEDINRIKGQALALRAYAYLALATVYSTSIDKDPNALCVPIYTEPSTYQEGGKERATITAVYQRILDDLYEAEKLIPDSYSRGKTSMDKYKVDKRVVYGLLARANLYAQHWAEAEKYAILAHQNASLMSESDYLGGFNDASNSEWIWGHPQISTQNNAAYVFYFLSIESTSGYRNFAADPYFMDLFDNTDYRKKMFKVFTLWKVKYLGYTKYRFRESTNADIVLMRVSEMYLIEAEAKARQAEKVDEALNVINDFKLARGAAPLAAEAQDKLIEDILKERRKELWGEGFALLDIIRNQKSVERKEYKGDVYMMDGTLVPADVQGHWATQFPDGSQFVANSPYYIWAISQSEMDYNPNI